MSTTISAAIERIEGVLERRPDFGRGTDQSVTTLLDGVHCTTTDGKWTVETDLSPALGGTSSAPTPGVLARAALGSCLAMMCRMRADRHGIEVTSVTVTVEADSAIAGMILTDSGEVPGYSDVRCHVEIESPAHPDEVQRIIDEGDLLSPVSDVFGRAMTVRRTTAIRTVETSS